jgi:hypothetical protein
MTENLERNLAAFNAAKTALDSRAIKTLTNVDTASSSLPDNDPDQRKLFAQRRKEHTFRYRTEGFRKDPHIL